MNHRQVSVAVLPVAGLGTRLLPLTKSIPKELLPLGRRPCVEHIVAELYDSGIRQILFVNSADKQLIGDHFQRNLQLEDRLIAGGKKELADQLIRDSWCEQVSFQTVNQSIQKGLGDAVLCAKNFVGDQPFAIALGDSIINSESQEPLMQRMIRQFNESHADIVVAFQKVPAVEVVHYGIAQLASDINDGVFDLADVVEKPNVKSAPSQFAIAARYVLSSDIFEVLENTGKGAGGEVQLTDAISSMIKNGAIAKGVCLNETESRIDIGSVEGYCKAFIEMAMADEQAGDYVRQLILRKAESILAMVR